MISETKKELIKRLFLITKNREYIARVIATLPEEEKQKRLLEFLNDKDNVTKTDIEIEMISIDGLWKKPFSL